MDVVAFGTLAHGLPGGTFSKDKVNHDNAHIPLFSNENIDKNLSLVEALREIASEMKVMFEKWKRLFPKRRSQAEASRR